MTTFRITLGTRRGASRRLRIPPMLRTVAVGAAAALLATTAAIGWNPDPAEAAVGDLRETVDVPAAAQCASGLSTSVAVVPGSMVDASQPVLLVVSCFNDGTGEHDTLYFLDPATNPATVAKTITTSTTPPQGWGSLAVRGDKGDLLGCGSADDGTHAIYAIDIHPFNGVADGTATFLFNAQPGNVICDGMTWDATDDTIFQSPDVSDTIYHFSSTGTLLDSFAAPDGCPNSGLAVGGESLFASCNGVLTIHQLDKTNGSPATSFSSGGSRTEDLECDPVSFAASNIDVMWSKDAFDNQIFAFEIPQGTCGFAGGPLLPKPQCTDTDGNGSTDNDGDGLCDNWETTGIDSNNDGTVDLQLHDVDGDGVVEPGEDADPNHKDLYLELDFMAMHQPNADAVSDVVTAFANSPVTNPDGATGIRLHVQVDEQVAHNDDLAFEPCTVPATGGAADFDVVKSASFGTTGERTAGVNVTNAKRFAFHYGLFAHNLLGEGSTSGCAELPGNDLIVSLGSWTSVGGHPVGTRDEQAGTLMHEFGHNLDLRHGGSDNTNCKPNYLSVMSYSRQIDNNPIPGRPLDYSRADLPTLDETNLDETLGISGPAGDQTAYGPPPVQVTGSSGPIDWNRDGDGGADTSVAADINNLGAAFGCGGSGSTLTGHDDWANLRYDFYNTPDFADGVHLSTVQVTEITAEQASELAPLQVGVEVRPRTIKLPSRGKGVVSAAILSTDTFDATTVDPLSVCFGDAEEPGQRDCTEAHGRGHVEDVNGDGVDDLVLHFETGQTGIDAGDTNACLTGRTPDQTIVGCDTVVVIP